MSIPHSSTVATVTPGAGVVGGCTIANEASGVGVLQPAGIHLWRERVPSPRRTTVTCRGQRRFKVEYYSAAICLGGHYIDALLNAPHIPHSPVPDYCAKCGNKVITNCPTCGTRLRGAGKGSWPPYVPSNFCDSCGTIMPWASREAIAAKLVRDLSEEVIDPAERLRIKEEVAALADPKESDDKRTRAGEWLKKAAPAAWKNVSPLVYSLASAAVRAHLGLPPAP